MWIKFYIKALLNGFSFKRAVKQANLDNRTIPEYMTKKKKESLLKTLNNKLESKNYLTKCNHDITTFKKETKDISDRFDTLYDLFPNTSEDK
jgi:hypothetical protein